MLISIVGGMVGSLAIGYHLYLLQRKQNIKKRAVSAIRAEHAGRIAHIALAKIRVAADKMKS